MPDKCIKNGWRYASLEIVSRADLNSSVYENKRIADGDICQEARSRDPEEQGVQGQEERFLKRDK